MQSSSVLASTAITTTTPSGIRDDVYCHLTARRAVARAALHLGVETMTAEAVDVLASCLLDYLQRLGSATAATAEAAGRSSAHCNVLDVLAATELCTTVAASVHQHHNEAAAGAGSAASAGLTADGAVGTGAATGAATDASFLDGTEWNRRAASWKDLAVFCFGPDWSSSSATISSNSSSAVDGDVSLRDSINRGKVGPSAAGMRSNGEANMLDAGADSVETGWNAPFPDEIPPFPACSDSKSVANPHTFPVDGLALHALESAVLDGQVDMELNTNGDNEMIPDVAFQIDNRVLDRSQVFGEKRKLDAGSATTDGNLHDERPAKRVKIADGTAVPVSTTTDPLHAQRSSLLPSYVPVFYPPFPSHQDSRVVIDDTTGTGTTTAPPHVSDRSMTNSKTVARPDSSAAESTTDSTRQVRSALVNAYKKTSTKSYWGSSWTTTLTDNDHALQVPPGRPTTTEAFSASIVPLNRASGSRVSRILEGSMDPPVL